jgi:NAD(P)-dependent dehydrogenase (short-subunit alcohol dehydrogenase family)
VTEGPRLSGKSIVVTGAAQGIGAAIARRCAADGAAVALVDRQESVVSVAAEIGGDGIVCDVTDSAGVGGIVASIAERLGSITGLVNAAALQRNGDVAALSDEDWDEVFAVNVDAPPRWMRAAMPFLLAAGGGGGGGGSIVNITSVTASAAIPDTVSYVASKHALLGMTRSVAVDFGRRGVRCNAVSPGTIQTSFFADYAARNPEKAAGQVDANYVGRLGEPDEVAALCAHLLGDEAGFINGANLAIDGGRLIGI